MLPPASYPWDQFVRRDPIHRRLVRSGGPQGLCSDRTPVHGSTAPKQSFVHLTGADGLYERLYDVDKALPLSSGTSWALLRSSVWLPNSRKGELT